MYRLNEIEQFGITKLKAKHRLECNCKTFDKCWKLKYAIMMACAKATPLVLPKYDVLLSTQEITALVASINMDHKEIRLHTWLWHKGEWQKDPHSYPLTFDEIHRLMPELRWHGVI